MTEKEKTNIKYRLSDLGVKVGELALEYISELEKENAELKEQKKLLSKRITELQADKGRLIDENSLTRVLIDRCKELGIKDLYHLKDLLEIVEVKKLEILELRAQIGSIKRENEDLKTFLTNNIVNNTQSYLLSVSNGS